MKKLRNLIDLNPTDAQAAATSSDRFKVGIVNQSDGSVDLLIYGYVGDEYDGLDAKSIAEFLAENRGKRIRARINSGGGLAFDGITIHNALIKYAGEVVVEIEGIAGSAAAIIAMAGNTVRIHDNASLFLHRASGGAWGNTLDMLDMAEFLEILDGQIARTFAAKSGQTTEAMMKVLTGKRDGTTFDAEAAVAAGLCDEIIPIRGNGQAPDDGTDDATDAAGTTNDTTSTTDGDTDHTSDGDVAAQVTAEQKAERDAANDRLRAQLKIWELEYGVAKNCA